MDKKLRDEIESDLKNRIKGCNEMWVNTSINAAERLNKAIGADANEIEWLASVLGKLASIATSHAELRGQLKEHITKTKASQAIVEAIR